MLENLIKEAKEELKDWAQGEVAEYEVVPDDVGDQVFEIADSSTPVYYSDMMQCANDDYSLMHEVPECRGKEDTPMRLLQLNIYDRIEQELYEYWRELEGELQGDLDAWSNLQGELDDTAEDKDMSADDALEAWEESGVPDYLDKVVDKYISDLFPEED